MKDFAIWPAEPKTGYFASSATLSVVANVLIASDLPALRAELRSMLEAPDTQIIEVASGPEVRALVTTQTLALALLDLQIGSMGAMAICLDLRHEESYGAAPHVPVLMLLDRRPDVFLARRSGAEGFVVKPLDPLRVRRADRALLRRDGYEDDTWLPATVRVAATTPQ